MLAEIVRTLKAHTQTPARQIGGVNGGVNQVLSHVRKHPGCRANRIADALSIPLRNIQRHLAALKNAGKLEFRGAPKNGGYWPLGK